MEKELIKKILELRIVVAGIICFIVSCFFINYFSCKSWLTAYEMLKTLKFSSSALQLYVAQLSMTFISLTVFYVLTDNNSKIIYWENIIEKDLIRKKYFSFYDESVYIYVNLVWGMIALIFDKKSLVLVYFLISLFLLINISVRIIGAYHNEQGKEKQLLEEYHKIFEKGSSSLDERKNKYDEIFDYIEKYTIEAFNNNDIKTVRRNLAFLEVNCGNVRPSTLEKIYRCMKGSSYDETIRDIIYKGLLMVYKDEFSASEYNEKLDMMSFDNKEFIRFYYYYQYSSVVINLYDSVMYDPNEVYFDALMLLDCALSGFLRIVEKCEAKNCKEKIALFKFQSNKLVVSDEISLLIDKYKSTHYVDEYMTNIFSCTVQLYWKVVAFIDNHSTTSSLNTFDYRIINQICKTLHPIMRESKNYMHEVRKRNVDMAFDINSMPDDLKKKYSINGKDEYYIYADAVKNAFLLDDNIE